MLGLILVDLVDRYGSVNNRGLDSLLLNNGLDGLEYVSGSSQENKIRSTDLVNVVVNMLASNDGGNRVSLLFGYTTVALELSSFLLETGLDSLGIAVLVVTLLNGDDVVLMLFRKNFTVVHGLDRGVVMVLVNLAVDGSGSLFVTLLNDSLVHNCGSNFLVDGGVMFASLVPVERLSVTVI